MHKPKVGQTVYIETELGISGEKVIYVGEKDFIVEDYPDKYPTNSIFFEYKDYKTKWYKSLKQIKKNITKLAKRQNTKIRFKQVAPCYWEVVIE